MAMSPSVKRYYVSSTLTLGAILMFLTSCGAAYLERDRMVAISMMRTYVKVCRPDQATMRVPGSTSIESGKPEMARWAKLSGDTVNGTTLAIPVISDGYCVEIGNNTPPQGFWGKFFDFLAAAAPIVGLGFGIPAL